MKLQIKCALAAIIFVDQWIGVSAHFKRDCCQRRCQKSWWLQIKEMRDWKNKSWNNDTHHSASLLSLLLFSTSSLPWFRKFFVALLLLLSMLLGKLLSDKGAFNAFHRSAVARICCEMHMQKDAFAKSMHADLLCLLFWIRVLVLFFYCLPRFL